MADELIGDSLTHKAAGSTGPHLAAVELAEAIVDLGEKLYDAQPYVECGEIPTAKILRRAVNGMHLQCEIMATALGMPGHTPWRGPSHIRRLWEWLGWFGYRPAADKPSMFGSN